MNIDIERSRSLNAISIDTELRIIGEEFCIFKQKLASGERISIVPERASRGNSTGANI